MMNQKHIFTFGEAVEVTESDLLGFYLDEDLACPHLYHTPPYAYQSLIDATKESALHESSLNIKAQIFTSIFQSNRYLNVMEFNKFITDYLHFGTAFLQKQRSGLGNILKLTHLMAAYTRIGREEGRFYFVPPNYDSVIELEDLFTFKSYDPKQNIYGRPSYLAALPSIRLTKEATFFRIKYYINGSHAGFILSINAEIDDKLMKDIETQLKETKGGGSFRNLLLNLPGGNKESVQLIPISEIAAKDEFFNIKRVADEDINTAHRVPPSMMGITPKNAGGFGNPEAHATVFYTNEILPIITMLKEMNEVLGVEAFRFSKYTFEGD